MIDELDINQLDDWLTEQESQYSDIVPNTEKSIQWVDNIVTQTNYSIVYLHGFSASAREISPIPEQLGKQLKANVFFTRLTGHGRNGEAMAEGSCRAWQADAEQAYQIGAKIGEKVILLSSSTGGTLATWLATRPFTKALTASVMLSPNFGVKNRTGELLRWDWGYRFAEWVNGEYRESEPRNELHKLYWTERYPLKALIPMVELVDKVLEIDKQAIHIPHLMIFSEDDQVVRVDRIREVAAQLNNARVDLLPFAESIDPRQHLLGGDACSPPSTAALYQLIVDYLQSIIDSSTSATPLAISA